MSRWWAPSGAHLGPDETDLERLQPGADKRLDLGQYLLTVHRMGAAACEEVASGPIPDEFALVERLAAARAVFAPPVVEAVSKSLNGDRPYADLLVRDVLDDAEQGALAVFRTAVAGGVPASLAAQRAGMVYGCPPDALGAFLPVAKELRAHPAALQDAADRVLFTAVEKAVDEEIAALEPQFEEVSKAPAVLERTAVARPDQATTPYYDARDVRGRFARGAQPLTERLAAAVGEKKKEKQLRDVRQTRQVRQVREVRQVAKPKTEAKPGVKVQAAQIQAAQVLSPRMQQAMNQPPDIRLPRTPTGGGRSEWPDNLMDRVNDQPPYTQQDHSGELRIALGQADWNDMLGRMGEGKMFRIGHVVRRMGAGSVQPPNEAHEENISEIAGRYFGDTGKAGPNIKVIPKSQLDRWEINGTLDAELEKLAGEMADEYLLSTQNMVEESRDYGLHHEVEVQEILAGRYFDKDRNRILVHKFPESEIAPIVELAIPQEYSYGVRAAHTSRSGPGDIDLDPNQVYRVIAVKPDEDVNPKYGAKVNRYAIAPVDDDELEALDIAKAAALLAPDRLDTDYYDARDVRGRFAAAPSKITERLAARAKTQPQTRQLREVRQVRQTKPAKATPEQMQAALSQARTQQARVLSPTIQHAKVKAARITQAIAKDAPTAGKTGPGYYPIDPGRSYAVMQPADLAKLVGGGEGPVDPDVVAQIVGANYATSRLTGVDEYNGRLLFGDDLHPDLYDMDEEWDEGEPEWEYLKTPYPLTMIKEIDAVDGEDEAQAARYRVDENAVEANATSMRLLANAMFENDPTITRLRLVKQGERDGVMAFRDLRDFGQDKPDPIVLVEIDDDLKMGKPAVLEVVSETRKNRLIPPTNNVIRTEEADSPDLAEQSEHGPGASNAATFRNPKIRLYRLKNA